MAFLSGVTSARAVCKPYSSSIAASSGRLIRRRGRGVLVRCRGFVWSKEDLQRLDELSHKPRNQLVPDVLEQCQAAEQQACARASLSDPTPCSQLSTAQHSQHCTDAEPPPQVVPPSAHHVSPPSCEPCRLRSSTQSQLPHSHQHHTSYDASVIPSPPRSPAVEQPAIVVPVACDMHSPTHNPAAVTGISSTLIHLTL